jgi:hypothetical protein
MSRMILAYMVLGLFKLLSPIVARLQKMIDAFLAGGPLETISGPRPVVLVRVFIDARAVLLALPIQRRLEPISLRLQGSMDMDVFSTGLRRAVGNGLYYPRPGVFAETVVLRRTGRDIFRDEVEDGQILPCFRSDAEPWDYETVPYDYAA